MYMRRTAVKIIRYRLKYIFLPKDDFLGGGIWYDEFMEEQKIDKKDNKTTMYIIVGLIGLIVIYFLTTSVIPRALITMTKAAPSQVTSLSDSYLLGNKLVAKADGKDEAIVNVFVLDKEGKPVAGKRVTLSGVENYRPVEGISDSEGKVVFNITSMVEKQYTIEAMVGGTSMGKKIGVTFRN
jgi:hypothetical protein